ncbi:MAG: right-handed parallel beta-helix repeat-containing protein, partial [Promethearchaeota archaeon]
MFNTKHNSGKSKLLVLTLLFSLLFTLGAENLFSSQNGVLSTIPSKILPHASGFWENTSITIDENAVSNTTQSGNWAWAVDQDWCSGLGTVDQPYLIENMTLSPETSSGLLIKNSKNVYFTIENCTFLDPNKINIAGIQLENTNSGTIVGCNISSDQYISYSYRGISLLDDSNHNTIENNTITGCKFGIYFDYSNNNLAVNNTINDCRSGIYNYYSGENHIIKNDIINTEDYGLYLRAPVNLTISGNVITSSEMSIYAFGGGANNSLINNQISGSTNYDINLEGIDYWNLTGNTMESIGLYMENCYYNQIDTTNTVGGKPIYYYEDQDNLYLDGDVLTDISQLFVVNSVNSTITNFDIHGMPVGIYVARGVSMNINNNNVSENGVYGLCLIGLNDSAINGNTVNDNVDAGIYIEGETGIGWDDSNPDFNLISGNNIFSNNSIGFNGECGFSGDYGYNDTFSNNYIMNNSEDGMYFQYFYHTLITENEVSNNGYGVDLYESPNSMIVNNLIYNNTYAGFYVEYSDETTIEANSITGNDYGMEMYDSFNCDILENEIIGNSDIGIEFQDMINSTIVGNHFENTSDTGLYIHSYSDNNTIYHNKFINTNLHALDDGEYNQWYLNGVGNYWDNYTGTDSNNDGIGDQPYNISGSANSQDLYPMLDLFNPTIEADDDCL